MDEKKITRFDFFIEVKNDLKKTAKEIFFPIIEDDIYKIDDIVDEVIGVEWYSIGVIDQDNFSGIKELYINNQNIVVFFNGENFKAVEKTCPECQSILNWISYEEKFKCFKCDKEYYVKQEENNSDLKYFSLKKQNNTWIIGLYKL